MLCLVRAQLYRMFREWSFWFLLALVAVVPVCSAAFAAYLAGDGSLAASLSATSSDIARTLDAATGETPVLSLYGSAFVNGSFVAMAACAFTAGFVAPELGGGKRSGFVKNLLQAPGGRISYALSQVVTVAVAGALFVAAGIAATEVGYGVAGFSVLPASACAFALWAAQVWLAVLAYQLVTLVVAFVTKSEWASVILGVFLGGFAIEKMLALLMGAASLALNSAPIFACTVDFLASSSLMAQMQLLARGELCGAGVYVVAGAVIAVSAALALLIMRRRGLG